jgi:UDP-N-acetylmuramoyl-tripeptide--D-alanyl-D-alanine ligase
MAAPRDGAIERGGAVSHGLDWTLAAVASVTGGRVVGDQTMGVASIGTDSRDIAPGSLFVAIAGAHFDGHDFAADARTAGAAAVLVDTVHDIAVVPRVEVADTVTALRDLAAHRRSQLTMPVVAVTGSTGKTSTKDLLAAALPGAVASRRSFNNEVGVPLTVLAAPLDAPYLVLEVGSRGRHHIEWLMPAVRPDVAIVTNLGVVHLETFGTEEVLADAKFELIEGVTEDGTAVLPDDEPRLHRPHRGTTVTFGRTDRADVRVDDVSLDEDGKPTFTVHVADDRARLSLPLAGAHHALNAAAAIAAARAVGVDLETAASGMAHAVGSPWRMEIHRGSITVVNDAYNANPTSVASALQTVAAMPGRHVAVLGRMAELGPVTEREHLRIGRLAAELGFAAVVVVGDDPGIGRGAGKLSRGVSDAEAAARVVRGFVRDGDVVLVKASRAVGLEALALDLVEETTR